jgi:hypothetical protein
VVGARISGLSPTTFRTTCLDTGRVKIEDGKVVLSSLADHLGRLISLKEYLAAHRALDLRRERQREYAARKRCVVWRGRIAA